MVFQPTIPKKIDTKPQSLLVIVRKFMFFFLKVKETDLRERENSTDLLTRLVQNKFNPKSIFN